MNRTFFSLRTLAILSFIIQPIFSSHAGDITFRDEPEEHRNKLIAGVGYGGGYTQLSGTAGVAHGPLVDFKYVIENDGSFLLVNGGGGAILGLEKSIFGASAGVGLGGQNTEGWGMWLGVDYHKLLSYKSKGALRLKLGGFIPASPSSRIDLHFIYATYPVETATKIYRYSYAGVEIVFGFQILD